MSWTYNPALVSNTDLVRFRIGDIEAARELLQNETIGALLTTYNQNVMRVSIVCVRAILAMFARDVNRSVAGVSGSVDQMTMHYRDLLRDLISEMNTEAGIYPGAIKIATADNLDNANGDTYKAPEFRVGQFDSQNATSAYSLRWDYSK